MERQFEEMPLGIKRMVLRLRLLVMIKHGKTYPYALLKQLEKTGFAAVMGSTLKNDVYNTLKSLERGGYIKVETRLESGKAKDYYTVTKKGEKTFKQVIRIMISSAKEANKQFG